MRVQRISKHLVLGVGLVLAVGALGANQAQAEQQTRSRTSVSNSSKAQSQSGRSAVRGSSSRRSGSGAGVTRSGDRYRSGSRGSHRGYNHRRPRLHFGLGYYGYHGGWSGYYRGYYYSPFYYGYPVYYSYRPERFRDFGAVDLNVRPKKTEVWVDGQYVGTAGRFDGYPGYLWLGDGRHELIFYNQGFETLRREIKVLEGVVLDISHRMIPGPSVPAEELTVFADEELNRFEEEWEPGERPREFEERARAGSDSTDRDQGAGEPIRRDVREEPGRLKLEIAPADASIYLDGRFLGSGQEVARLRSGLMVSPGEHTLEIVRPGFDSREIAFTIESGEETVLEIDLEARV